MAPPPEPHHHVDEAAAQACLVETLSAALQRWQQAHGQVTLYGFADGVLFFAGTVLTHLWRTTETTIPDPPLPWRAFVERMQAGFARALQVTHETCACATCRPSSEERPDA